ncbi:hypothetical protein EE612_018710 [Oryza sativa]|nr:hypothetical protein EE612_018710 [Oryza sativa]
MVSLMMFFGYFRLIKSSSVTLDFPCKACRISACAFCITSGPIRVLLMLFHFHPQTCPDACHTARTSTYKNDGFDVCHGEIAAIIVVVTFLRDPQKSTQQALPIAMRAAVVGMLLVLLDGAAHHVVQLGAQQLHVAHRGCGGGPTACSAPHDGARAPGRSSAYRSAFDVHRSPGGCSGGDDGTDAGGVLLPRGWGGTSAPGLR